mmetsp:Transcript_77864/g.242583  ORF Transcript_77864/g.242583 Transcript_77864/m.242583 type:complete len:260 (+) Transcript_77864:104-883(+)
MVVLSSLWQRPQHRERRERLERAISEQLGSPFAFDARTGPRDESTAPGRLRAIGDFLSDLCAWRAELGGDAGLRVLVLEDFHITALDGWPCDGEPMESTAAVERYLQQRALSPMDLSVKLIHTYDEWRTPSGLLMQVGAGLTLHHYCQAARFLGSSCGVCEQAGAEVDSAPASRACTSHCGPHARANGNLQRRRKASEAVGVTLSGASAAQRATKVARVVCVPVPVGPLSGAGGGGATALASGPWRLRESQFSVACRAR